MVNILPWAAAAAVGAWLQPQLPDAIGFVIQAVLMLISAWLILLGIVATIKIEETDRAIPSTMGAGRPLI